MKKIKVLSLFDGISCARLALDKLGYKDVEYYASEIDKYAIQVSNKNWDDIKQLGSVTDLHFSDGNSLVGTFDLLIGGSPCQDLSIAKKNRQGLNGERSGLFWEYVRILREVKPKYFVLENVNSMSKVDKDIITKTLGVEPIMINASLVSAQNRKRLFWTNISGVTLPEDRNILLRDILEPTVDESFYVKPKSNTVRTSGRGSGVDDKHNWDTIRIGQIGKGGQGDRIYSKDGKSVALSANGGGRGAKTGLYAITNNGYETNDSIPEIGQANRVYNPNGKIIPLNNWSPKVRQNEIVRKLTPIECERLQSLPDNYTEGISNTQRYKCCGNAFNADVVAHILSFMK